MASLELGVVAEQCIVALVHHVAGADGVDADAVGAEIHRGLIRQPHDSALDRGVGQVAPRHQRPLDRRDVDLG